MATCIICHKSFAGKILENKERYTLGDGAYICYDCAKKISLKSSLAASFCTAKKAKENYFFLYPEEKSLYRDTLDIDDEHIMAIFNDNTRPLAYRRSEVYNYVSDEAAVGSKEAIHYVSNLLNNIKQQEREKENKENNEFINKVNSVSDKYSPMTLKELLFLKTILHENEEVLDVVSGIMEQNGVNISGNYKETSAINSSATRTWLLALTDNRIMLINRHLLIGTEYIEIPLSMINSISCQSRLLFSSISIMHGSGGIIINNIQKGSEIKFVKKTNLAIEKVKNNTNKSFMNSGCDSRSENNNSVADEILKLKKLFDNGILTKEEYEKQKEKILN